MILDCTNGMQDLLGDHDLTEGVPEELFPQLDTMPTRLPTGSPWADRLMDELDTFQTVRPRDYRAI